MAKTKYIQEVITTGKFTLPVVVIVVSIVWLLGSFSPIKEVESGLIWEKLLEILQGPLLSNFIAFLLLAASGVLLMLFQNAFALIREHTNFHLTLFFLFAGLIVPQNVNVGSVLVPCMLMALYSLFHTYQKKQPVGHTFQAFFFIGLGSLLFSPFLYYAPLLYIGLYYFRGLTLRSFFAGIAGLLLPYWVLFAFAFFTGNMPLFYEPFLNLSPEIPPCFDSWSPAYVLPLIYMTLISIAGNVHCMSNNYEDKIRTRLYLSFFALFQWWTFLFMFGQPQHFSILFPLFITGSCLPLTHLFVLTHSKGSNIFFIVCVILFIALLLFNLWTHILNIY